jgi:hypothetical protein
MLRRSGLALLVLALLALVAIPAASAARPIRETVHLEGVTAPDAYLSNACGKGVLDTFNATLTATVIVDRGGTPRSELDTLIGTINYAAPSNGKSLTRPVVGISQTSYPAGGSVGSPARVTITGFNTGSFTGVSPPGAGQIVANAVVVGVDPAGVPETAFGASDIVSMHGNFAAATTAICSTLR